MKSNVLFEIESKISISRSTLDYDNKFLLYMTIANMSTMGNEPRMALCAASKSILIRIQILIIKIIFPRTFIMAIGFGYCTEALVSEM